MGLFDEAKKLFGEAKTFAQSEEGQRLTHEVEAHFHHGNAVAPEYAHHGDGHHSHAHEHGEHGHHPHSHHHAGGDHAHVHPSDHSLHDANPEHQTHHRP